MNGQVNCHETFEQIFISTSDKHVPLKKEVLWANQTPYMTQALTKAIMRRFQLQTKYFKNNKVTIFHLKNENFCSKLYKKVRNIMMTVCSYHVTYGFQSESTLYSCLNVKELLARSRRKI